MKLSLNWLKEFVDLEGIDADQIMRRLTQTTAEVEGYEKKGDISGIVAAQIITCVPHPNSKKPLNLLTVDNGQAIVSVVCGAPNCRAGMRVALAKPGARLGKVEIGVATLAGEQSHGMCCSGAELGISTNHDGIIDLGEAARNVPNGTPIEKVLPDIFDVIFEIENKSLTNRPDLWGHYGFARELSVIFDKKLKPLPMADLEKYRELPPVKVEIEDKENCYSLSAFHVQNITRRVSPLSMQIRLFYCGISSHAFLVDLSNYIMLELGQPNHAFDARVMGRVTAGNINDGSHKTFDTLKGQSFEIQPHHLFIKSDGVPVSLAGIMGGANSLITNETTGVVFEFATFNPYHIRKTTQELNIRSDSSTRYEKSLDTNLNKIGAARAIKILSMYDKNAKVASRFSQDQAKPTKGGTITLDRAYLERFCGITFDYAQVKKNLRALGFNPVITKDNIIVTVPSWRATKDVSIAADIIEEIARTFGFDNIVQRAPMVQARPVTQPAAGRRANLVRDTLVNKYEMQEVHTYVWNDAKAFAELKIETPSYLKIVNNVARDNDQIRSDIVPHLVNIVAKNKGRDNVRIFEIGKVFKPYPDEPESKERTQLAIAVASKTRDEATLYIELGHLVRDLFGTLGLRAGYELGNGGRVGLFHPKNNAKVFTGEQAIGVMGVITPVVTSTIDSKMSIVAAAMCMDTVNDILENQSGDKGQRHVRVSRFPKTTLDFTITSDRVYGDLEMVFDKFGHELLRGYELKDLYKREDGTTSYTLTFTIASYEKTLTTEEINTVWQKIVDHGKKFGFSVDNT